MSQSECWLRNSTPPSPHVRSHTLSLSHTHTHTHTLHALQSRVSQFERWLRNRSERLIVLVGHSSFWASFTKARRLANCEVMEMAW